MEQTLDRAAAEVPQVDPEAFRRVWARVMPDQKNSPIVVKPLEGNPAQARPADVPPPGREIQSEPTTPGPSQDTGSKAENGEESLRQLIDLAEEGAEAVQTMARRAGSGASQLSGLTADHRRAMRQLSAAYFLETGQRYQPKRRTPVRSKGLIQALREQYLWEQQWAQACLQTAKRMKEESIQDLCRELAQDASLHNCVIRRLLEQKM